MPSDHPPPAPASESSGELGIALASGALTLRTPRLPIEITGATVGLTLRRNGRRASWEAGALRPDADGAQAVDPTSGVRVEIRWTVTGEVARLDATLEHGGDTPVALEEIRLFAVRGTNRVRIGSDAAAWSIFRNGYQSWSGTRAYGVGEADADPFWRFLRDTVTDVKHPAAGRNGIVRSDLVTAVVDRRSGAAFAIGWLETHEYFGAIAVAAPGGRFRSLSAVLDGDGRPLAPGERLVLPPLWLAVGEDGAALLAAWAEACGARMHARVGPRSPVGWCSWYYYFTRVSEADVLRNAEAMDALRARVRCDYVMVDDGYQRSVGDWLEPNRKFPHGMRWLAQAIRARGFDAGIWMAPFIARPESQLFRERPDWFVRTARGRPRSGAWNPMWSLGRPAYALDTTHPAVLEWLHELARTVVHQWGYRILKLDFLYAAALPGVRYDASATRAQALRRGLEAIRAGAGDEAFLLGCGCPLGPAIGLVDGMRIGADVAPFWTNWISRWLLRDRHGVATKHAIRNTLTRAFMHRHLWLNDPDCLMVRSSETALSRDEVHSLAAAIGLTDGMLVLSDDVAALPEERLAVIEQALQLSGGRAHVVDLFARDLPELVRCAHPGGEVLGVFNFGRRAADRRVALADFSGAAVRELWSGADLPVADAGVLLLPRVPPHGCRLLWLGRTEPDEAEEPAGIDGAVQ